MFEFMHKYRALILGVLLFGLVGLGAWTAIAGLFGPDQNPVEGTLLVPGETERIEVRRDEFLAVLRNIKYGTGVMGSLVGDDDERLAAWCFIALRELGRAVGIRLTDAQVRQIAGLDEGDRWRSDADRNWAHAYLLAAAAKSLCMGDPRSVT